jgi:hypothetical protein
VNEIVEDMIDISQRAGITKNLDRYIKRYLFLGNTYKKRELQFVTDAYHKNILQLLDKLNMFCPNEVIEAITDECDAELRLIKTLAYGAAQNNDVFLERLQYHIESGGDIRGKHLYYCPLAILDSSYFWSMIIKLRPELVIQSCGFDSLVSNIKSPSEWHFEHAKEYEDIPPFLHLARVEQDIEKMEFLSQKYPSWNDPMLCVRYFKFYGMMPTWKEFYCLEDIDSRIFLTNKRPGRFM